MPLSVKLFASGLLISSSLFVVGGCCPPESIEVSVFRADGECQMDINYEGTALGVYVMEPEYFEVTKDDNEVVTNVEVKKVEFPRSNDEFGGIVFFGLDTTTFPDGIVPPVRYGETEKDRAIDTKNAFMRGDSAEFNRMYDPVTKMDLGTSKYAVEYPMSLESKNTSCARCELSAASPTRTVGAFKIGVVTVPGNTELAIPGDEETDSFVCPAPGEAAAVIYGTPLSPHRGVE